MNRWTVWLPAAVLGVGCILVSGQRDLLRTPLAQPLAQLPATFEDFSSKDLTIDDEQQRVAGMTNYLMRVFRRDTVDAWSLYVGYYDYQRQGKSIHSPKNCLPGAGWEPMSQSVVTLEAGGAPHPVNRYLLAKGPYKALVYYWYQGRGRVEANEYRVKWDLLRDAALSGRTEESLVRLVIPLAPNAAVASSAAAASGRLLTEAEGDKLAARVARWLIPDVSRALPQRG